MDIALVTGASSGMGREFARQIGAQAKVDEIWAVARREDRLQALQSEIPAVRVRALPLDLTQQSSIDRLKELLLEEQPAVRLLANCSGFAKFGGVDEVCERDALSMIDLNVRALVAVTMACIPHMPSGGHIIEIASTAAFQPLPDMNIYAACKAFVLSYSRALSRELGEKGVSVTAVCPGWTKTEFFDVAKKDASTTAVRNFLFPSKPEHVVARALRDAEKERELSIYGIFNKLHWFFAKILPAGSVMTLWNAMK